MEFARVSAAVDVLLFAVLVTLAALAARRGRSVLMLAVREGLRDFLGLLPRIAFGVIGAGFIAEMLPRQLIGPWLGAESGVFGVLVATLLGMVTPGGPVVGFSIAAAAWKGGAGAPQIVAYSVAWALLAVQRMVFYEVPMMPARVVWLRAAVSIPVPFLAAAGVWLLGHP